MWGSVAQVKNEGVFAFGSSKKPDKSSLFNALRVTDPRSGAWATCPDVGCYDHFTTGGAAVPPHRGDVPPDPHLILFYRLGHRAALP
jgi:hypothetical protein